MSRVSGRHRAARDSKTTRTPVGSRGRALRTRFATVMFILVTNTFENDVYGMFVGGVVALFVGPF